MSASANAAGCLATSAAVTAAVRIVPARRNRVGDLPRPSIHPSDSWPSQGHPKTMKIVLLPRLFSHQCLEGAFYELRQLHILGNSPKMFQRSLICVIPLPRCLLAWLRCAT